MFKNGTSLVVQCLRLHASTPRGTGSIPGWGTKILHAVWHSPHPPKKYMFKKYCVYCVLGIFLVVLV